ncbi:MAG: carotenoid biosynthesis protein, partial [Taibaiella sp.]|nr:carotenoid biosynthesis protein [Taibaiella sp.]
MTLDTPITWLIAEILAVVLFVICMLHASRQENGIIRMLELFGFIVYAAVFENVGVANHFYDYNLNRIMMIGKVPLEILMVEGAIFYAALRFVEYLGIPGWGKPLVIGLLSSVQDMTIDPVAVFDRYSFSGVMSGQWNWVPRYDGTFFGIPFYNFTGWVYIMVYYAIAIQLGAWLYKRYNREIIGYLYPLALPVVALCLLPLPITALVMFGAPFFPFYTRNVELILLVVNYAIGLFILLRYQKINRPFDFR